MECAPVVLIVFNRPKETKEVFQKLRKAKVPKLYIVMDAPRDGNEDDLKHTKEVLAIFRQIDWDCKVYKNIAEFNMGVGPRPYTGIDWVFETEDRAIILEDDCVPADGFFDFASELLERYKDDHRIMHISGSRYSLEFKTGNNDSYLFSKYQFNWGWATWKRAWKKYDFHLSNLDTVLKKGYFDQKFSKYEAAHWKMKFDKAREKKQRMWDYQWQCAVFINSGICIFPTKNLISNIGPFGTTAPNFEPSIYFRAVDDDFKIKEHPDVVIVNEAFDKYYFNTFIAPRENLRQRIKRRLKRFFVPKELTQRRIREVLEHKKKKFYQDS